MFFFTDAQRKYLVADERDMEELSICKIIIIDTGLFRIKRESFVRIEAEVMWIIQESTIYRCVWALLSCAVKNA